MKFTGVGIVRRKGKVIARFIDGTFETNDPAVQERLRELGFVEEQEVREPSADPAPASPPEKPKAKRKALK